MMRESAQEREIEIWCWLGCSLFFHTFSSSSISFLLLLFNFFSSIPFVLYVYTGFLLHDDNFFFIFLLLACPIPSLSCCSCRARHSFIHFSFRLENIEYVSWAWDGETCVVVEPPTLRWLFKFCLLRSLCVVFFCSFLRALSACVQFRFWAHVRRRPDLLFGEKRKSEGIILYVKKVIQFLGRKSQRLVDVFWVLGRENNKKEERAYQLPLVKLVAMLELPPSRWSRLEAFRWNSQWAARESRAWDDTK